MTLKAYIFFAYLCDLQSKRRDPKKILAHTWKNINIIMFVNLNFIEIKLLPHHKIEEFTQENWLPWNFCQFPPL
jgi:hypothetical protein